MATPVGEDEKYILFIRMRKSENPTISRVLCVPAHLDFRLFHLVIQAAFGWDEAHLYRFTVSEPRAANDNSYRGRNKAILSIEDSDECWDEEDAVAAQMAQFRGRPAPSPAPRALASECTLADVFKNPQFRNGNVEVNYEYDFGDGWDHEIVYLGKADGEYAKRQVGKGVVDGQETWCVSGEGHPCAEDCGGWGGWKELKQAFTEGADGGSQDISGRKAEELRRWYTTHCLNGEPEGLNPWKWDIVQVNQRLASLHC